MRVRASVLFTLAVAALAFCGCGGGASSVPGPTYPGSRVPASSSSPSPITHVVVIVQENRTFNDFFATFPGADGTTTGTIAKDPACGVSKAGTIALTKSSLVIPHDLDHNIGGYFAAYDKGKMDGFDKVLSSSKVPGVLVPVSVHRSGADPAVLGHGRAVRARRAYVYDARQQQFRRPPRPYCGRHAGQAARRRSWSRTTRRVRA